MVDYSKWNSIELSDDSDVECHPNVDKKSLIKWKQESIRQKRQEEKERKEYMRRQRDEAGRKVKELNDKLVSFSGTEEEKGKLTQELATAKEAEKKISDQIKKEEEEERKHPKWNTENICHTGFDSTIINKESKPQATPPAAASTSVSTSDPTVSRSTDTWGVGGFDEGLTDKFGLVTDLKASHALLATHKKKLINNESAEHLFTLAYKALLDGKEMQGKNYIKQALIIQYCSSLTNDDGLYWFFKRLAAKEHNNSQEVFNKELEDRFFTIQQAVERKLLQLKEKQKEQIEESTELTEEEKERAIVFQTLPKAMQEALEHGDDDKLNKFLASLTQQEAEEIVKKCEKYGIISSKEVQLDEQIKKVLEEIPIEVRTALENRDLDALSSFLKTMDPEAAQEVIKKCEDAGLIARKKNKNSS